MFWLRSKKIIFLVRTLNLTVHIRLEWANVYNWWRGQRLYFKKKNLSLKINFELANPNEMPHYAAFYLGIQCLPKYTSRGFQSTKKLGSKLLGSACSKFTLCLLVSSAYNLSKQIGHRSAPTKGWAWSGSNLFETQMVFLKVILEKNDFGRNKISQRKKKHENFSSGQTVKNSRPLC